VSGPAPSSSAPALAEARAGAGGILARLRTALTRGGFARNVAVVMSGTVAAQLLQVAASPVITRLYDPADMGLLAVYGSLVGILLSVSSLRYEMAIPVAEDDDEAAYLLYLSVGITVAMAAVVGAVLVLAGAPVLRLLQADGLLPYAWLIPAGIALGGAYQVLVSWGIRARAYGTTARTRVRQSVGLVTVQVGGGLLGAGPLGLLLGDVVGRTSGVGSFVAMLRRDERFRALRPSLAALRAVAVRFRRFPMVSSASALLNTSGLRVPALMLAGLYGPAVAGWFALSQRVVAIPLTWLGQSLAQVYFAEAARLAREDPPALERLFHRTVRRLVLLGGVPVLLGGLAAPFVFGALFGREWSEAGLYVLLLTPMLLGQIVVSPVSQTVYAIDRQGMQLHWDAWRFAAAVAAFAACAFFRATPAVGVAAYSVAMLGMYTMLYLLYRRALARFVRNAGHV